MTVRILVRKFGLLAIVRFVGPVPDGFRAFVVPELEELTIYCDATGRAGGYDFLPAQVACDFLRDHGVIIEPYSPDSAAAFREVAGIVSEPDPEPEPD